MQLKGQTIDYHGDVTVAMIEQKEDATSQFLNEMPEAFIFDEVVSLSSSGIVFSFLSVILQKESMLNSNL